MLVYHGSNSRFETLRLSKNLVKSEATMLNEGMGIYFSIYKDVAGSYGKYLYTLEINDKYLMDFRKKVVCKQYINQICKYIREKEDIYINQYFDRDNLVEYIYNGSIAVSGICREIYMLLDSNEYWYNLTESKIEKVYKLLENYDKKHLYAYLFNYNIKGVGIIKNVDSEIVRIVSREKVG